jgi:hypothetical protein
MVQMSQNGLIDLMINHFSADAEDYQVDLPTSNQKRNFRVQKADVGLQGRRLQVLYPTWSSSLHSELPGRHIFFMYR